MNPQALIVILQAREANSSIKIHSLPLVLALPCVTTIFVCKGALESDFSRPIHSPLNLGKQSMIGLDPITSALNIAPRPLQLLTPRPRRQGCSRRLESVAKLRRYCKFRTRMTGSLVLVLLLSSRGPKLSLSEEVTVCGERYAAIVRGKQERSGNRLCLRV